MTTCKFWNSLQALQQTHSQSNRRRKKPDHRQVMSLGSTEYTLMSLSSSSTFPMGKDCTVPPPKDHSNLGGRRVSPPFCKCTPFSGGRGRRDWYRPRLAACTCRFTVLGVRFRFKEGSPKPDLNPNPKPSRRGEWRR